MDTARLVLTDSGNAANKVDTAGGPAPTPYLGEPPTGQTKTMNMSLFWGPGSPNLNGSHGHWTILKADGSPTSSWNPPSGAFTGSGGAGTASSTWSAGTAPEREFKVRVWCDNVYHNNQYDVGEMVFERLVTVFKVEIKAPDGVNPPKDYVAVDSSVGYMAKITPEGTGVGFQWTDGNATGKFTFDNPA